MEKGLVIQGRYLLEERLGKGGMGQVWRAVDQRLQRTVAIKLIAPQFAEEPEFLVRFLREAQSIARINHPNVVGVLDFGEADEKPFLVMEYVPGKTLGGVTGEQMAPEKAVNIIAQAAHAAGAAHAEGIVHRDIKPANIIVTDDGRAKLVDFGIASHENVDRITATGTTIGSPHYISPEQASGGNATPRSDVYALGIVLFELLTGRRPFEGEQVAAIAIAHVEEAPPAPSQFVAGLDPELEKTVLRCLAKDPDHRFSDGTDLANALTPESDARTMVVPAAAGAAAAGSTMTLPADDAVEYENPPVDDDRDSPWKAALLGLLLGLVVLALAVGAYAVLSDEPDDVAERPERDRTEQRDPTPATGAPPEEPATSAPPEDPATSAPPEEEPPPEEPPPEEEPPPDEEPEEDDDETVEGGVEVDPDEGSNGQGPDGEGPPGQEKK